jgi:hypothetical protein
VDKMLEPSFWLPTVCFPIIASVLQKYDIVFCIICSNEELFTKQYYPDIWFGESPPIIVPILFSGIDNDGNKKKNIENQASGHYSGPFIGDLHKLHLQEGIVFNKATFEMRQTYMENELKDLYSCMIEGGKNFWGSFFPPIKKKYDLFRRALLDTIDVQDDEEETLQTAALQQLIPIDDSKQALTEFKRRLGVHHTHAYTSIFPQPRLPIVSVKIDNGDKVLTVRNVLSGEEEGDNSVVVTTFGDTEDSNMDHFMALAMSNQIMDNLKADKKLYHDVRFICDLLICK